MSRIITQAASVVGVLALAACADTESPNAQEGTTGEIPGITVAAEDGVGTAEEAVNPLPPAPLPYHGKFENVWSHLQTRRFVVPHLASLQVIITAAWNKPSQCIPNRSFKVSLRQVDSLRVGPPKIYRTDGRTQGASWQNLKPGTYYLDLDVTPARQDCMLDGVVNITL